MVREAERNDLVGDMEIQISCPGRASEGSQTLVVPLVGGTRLVDFLWEDGGQQLSEISC